MKTIEINNITGEELECLTALSNKLNTKEYLLLLRRTRYSEESLAESARSIGIKEDHARKLAHRLRKKIIYVLGLGKRS